MKTRSILQGAVLATIVGLALAATAADKAINTTVELRDSVQVNGQQLKAGTYNVKIVRNGSDAEVTLKNGKTMVTSHGQFVDGKEASAHDSYVLQEDGGTKKLVALKFYGKKETLMLSDADVATGSGH